MKVKESEKQSFILMQLLLGYFSVYQLIITLFSVYLFIPLSPFIYLLIILRQLQSSVHESAEDAGEKGICNNDQQQY